MRTYVVRPTVYDLRSLQIAALDRDHALEVYAHLAGYSSIKELLRHLGALRPNGEEFSVEEVDELLCPVAPIPPAAGKKS